VLTHALGLTDSTCAIVVAPDQQQWWAGDLDDAGRAGLAEQATRVRAGGHVSALVPGESPERRPLACNVQVEREAYVLAVARADPGPYGTAERKIIDALGAALGSALQLAALHEAELSRAIVENEHRTATQLASAVLASRLPTIDGIEVHASTIPARSVGGDYYTAVVHEGTLRFAVGDVAGKGLPAAVLMTNAITVSERVLARNPSDDPVVLLSEIADDLDRLLTGTNRFVTMLVGTVRMGDTPGSAIVALANAGHSPVLVATHGEVTAVPPFTPPVGVIPPRSAAAVTFVVEPGDFVAIGSDGLVEQDDDDGSQFGQDRLSEALLSAAASSPNVEGIVTNLLAAVGRHAGDSARSDDQTLLVIRSARRADS
jgi:serine phosphatase RsbU (regulator of sigma subunit)